MTQTSFENLKGHVLIVDDDEIILTLIENHLIELGIKNIATFLSGQEAWQSIRSNAFQFSLFIIDWKLKDSISGVAIFNRLRTETRYRHAPVLAISGTLEPDDFRLIEELPCTFFLAKPFSQVVLCDEVKKLCVEHEWFEKNNSKLQNLMQESLNDEGQLLNNLQALIKDSPHPTSITILAAEQLRLLGRHALAEQVILPSLKASKPSIRCLNEFGKNLLMQGRHEEALKILSAASTYSPKNLERLCMIGTAELNLGDPNSARKTFKKVLGIDPESKTATSGLEVAESLIPTADNAASAASPVTMSFASLTNTTAIAKVRSGMIDEGIELYRSALSFVNDKEIAAKIAFNIGLAYLRQNSSKKAYPWFIQAVELADEGLPNAQKYVAMIREAKGQKVPIDESQLSASEEVME